MFTSLFSPEVQAFPHHTEQIESRPDRRTLSIPGGLAG